MRIGIPSNFHFGVRGACAILAGGMIAAAAIGAEPIIYPSKGQSAAQLDKDKSECYTWSSKQTGYDPVAALQAQQAAAAKAQQDTAAAQNKANSVGGETAGGAVKGAVAGVAIGAVAGDAGKGAAIGATAGALRGSARHKGKTQAAQAEQQQVQQAQAQSQAAANQKFADYQKAWGACMEGRHYVIK
jgi:hypothetical protein